MCYCWLCFFVSLCFFFCDLLCAVLFVFFLFIVCCVAGVGFRLSVVIRVVCGVLFVVCRCESWLSVIFWFVRYVLCLF